MSAFDLRVAKKYVSLQQSAKKRGKDFDLSLTSLKNLLKAKKCYYTGVPLTHATRSIDRVDNTKGYIKGNVVACHTNINQLKGNLEMDTIIKIADKLKKRR
jgi:hypothetical protein